MLPLTMRWALSLVPLHLAPRPTMVLAAVTAVAAAETVSAAGEGWTLRHWHFCFVPRPHSRRYGLHHHPRHCRRARAQRRGVPSVRVAQQMQPLRCRLLVQRRDARQQLTWT